MKREWLHRGSLTAIVFLVAAQVGCGMFEDDSGLPCSEQTPFKTPPALDAVPETLIIGGARYTLECGLWRNFMPGPPSSHSTQLAAWVRLTEVDSQSVASDVSLDHLWVVRGDDYWSARFTSEEHPAVPAHQLERVARCGPLWETGGTADVVVQCLLGESDTAALKAVAVSIEAAH